MKSRLYLLYGSPVIIAIFVLASVLTFLNTENMQAATAVRYVSPGGVCGIANPCYSTIQSAVDAASVGDEIRIAEGVYTDVNHYAGLAQVVYLSKTVILRGGYSSDDWENSMPISHPTILDAQSAGRGLSIVDYILPTIENLTVRSGDAAGLSDAPPFQPGSYGAGLHAVSATVTIRNTVWSENHADVGSAIYVRNGRLSLLDSKILSNTAAILGGGVYLEMSDSRLAHNVIEGNGAAYGGGVAVYWGRAELEGNQIVSNQSGYHGGGVLFSYADGLLSENMITSNVGELGGGASLDGDILISQNIISQNSGDWGGGLALWDGAISLIGNTITDNRASFLGGGVALSYFASSGDPNRKIVSSNIISGNTSPLGGGLFLQFARPILMHNLIQDNSSSGDGGGIYATMSQIDMDGDRVTRNTAQGNGGGLAMVQDSQPSLSNVLLADNQAQSHGSALFIDRTSVDVAQTTIVNNRGETGIYVQSSFPLVPHWVTITNTIIASHTVGISALANSTVTLQGVLWSGNETEISGAGTYIITNMIYGDPAFTSDGYHLTAASAAIDSGLALRIFHDIDGEPRPYRQFDLGADEYWPAGVLKQIYLPIVGH